MVAGLYAYCRFTDDLVDDPHDDPSEDILGARLALWREWSMAAYEGEVTGIPVLDIVLSTAAQRGVSRLYPDALLDGVAMDLAPRVYTSWSDLERYTFGVAGAVGGWLCQLFDIHDPDLLERAHALGHGMQLTNIARDVGEDLERGRVYLPTEMLESHGLTAADIGAMARGEQPVSEAYRAAMQQLLGRADGYYDMAWPGIRELPDFFRRPVAAAAASYRGIHREVRRNGYDNLTQRAHTSLGRKLYLAGTGLMEARRAAS
jgi:phytoene synthase